MANPFESFVQTELGKRPYTSADGALEAVLVRRGPGPRQLTFVEIGEGQVLGKVGGVLVGVNVSAGGAANNMLTFKQVDASSTWTVAHGKNCQYFNYNVYVGGKAVIPYEVVIVDENTIEISFSFPVSGHVTFSFDLLAT